MEQFEISDLLKEKLEKAETLDEVVLACNEEAIEITKEDLEAADAATSGQLTENDLDNVTGGCGAIAIAVIVTSIAIAIYVYWKTKLRCPRK